MMSTIRFGVVDLSDNLLSGELPERLADGDEVKVVKLRNNRLYG